jgi:hypothetical protein
MGAASGAGGGHPCCTHWARRGRCRRTCNSSSDNISITTSNKHSSINDCICCGFWLTAPLTATIGWRLEQSQHATPPRITTTSIRPSINQCKLHLCPPHRHNPTTTSQTPNPFQAAQMDSPLPQVARHCLAHRAAPATDSTQPGCFCCLCLSAAWYTTTSQRLLDAQHNPHHHGLHPAKAANHWGLLCLHPLTPPPTHPPPNTQQRPTTASGRMSLPCPQSCTSH